MLEDLEKAEKKTVGMKQTLKAIEEGRARRVFLAKDIDDYLSQRIRAYCQMHSTDITFVDSMKKLGDVCGITVGAATAAILK